MLSQSEQMANTRETTVYRVRRVPPLERKRVVRATETFRGYDALLECGHKVWSPVDPGLYFPCAVCLEAFQQQPAAEMVEV